jgi:hypothetical protein
LQTPAGDRFGPSPIWDAVDEAVSALHLEPGWKHILLLTDGLATGNMKSMEEVVLRAASSDVTIHVVESGWLVKRDQSAAARSPHHAAQTRTIDASAGNLRRLATETGGLYLPRRVASAESQGPQRPPAVGRLFRQILDAIHAGYRLTVSGVDCEAPTDAQDVRVPSAPGASVHFRPNGLCGRRGASP